MNHAYIGPTTAIEVPDYVKHTRLVQWVQEIATLTKPDRIAFNCLLNFLIVMEES